jgi:hypothetical protein
MGRARLENDFGGIHPKGGYYPCVTHLPVAWLDLKELPTVRGVRLFQASLEDWLLALEQDRYVWEYGAWKLV